MAPTDSVDADVTNSLFEDARTLSQMKRSRIDLNRRYVFLCPTALSKQFEALPLPAKEAALLVFRCNQNFVFKDPPAVRKSRLQSRVECGNSTVKHFAPVKPGLRALYKSEFSDEFLQWVLSKEKEGCVFWFKPERDLKKLSAFFEEKIDPMDELPYRPLLLDAMWWRVRFDRTSSRYVGNPRGILAAIAAFHMCSEKDRDIDLASLQGLIYQSNPTLEPVVKWPHALSMRFLPATVDSDIEYKGYIEGNPRRPGLRGEAVLERIQRWPERPKDRLDNLHHHWQVQELSRKFFSRAGSSAVASGAVSAR
ncbi:unnamed protein product [Cladocopium goreaui]|uniref:Uncharacterized protein n=1 Tax=Cladocopium goreaui TaxID=2562237 RepID=A0A9P1CBI3_9DINO|nr:unnamed protein product [Cladocopium goreaui]|mmetsp:Transcript_73758/g.162878  ORF Transcript_73758/g.162878 Transcript_73758/m.162878 type:complete len:309 (-) Transcript_73758:114-1040(-)